MGDDEQAESERSAAGAEAQAHGILKNADAWAAKMKGSKPAVLSSAADVFNLVERHGRFSLCTSFTPGDEVAIHFENDYD